MNLSNTLKRWFRERFGIMVRCRSTGTKRPYFQVWIPSQPREYRAGEALVYPHDFPPELGNACMRAVYPDSASLGAQNWGGNIGSHLISMHAEEWEAVMASFPPA